MNLFCFSPTDYRATISIFLFFYSIFLWKLILKSMKDFERQVELGLFFGGGMSANHFSTWSSSFSKGNFVVLFHGIISLINFR